MSAWAERVVLPASHAVWIASANRCRKLFRAEMSAFTLAHGELQRQAVCCTTLAKTFQDPK